MALKYPRKLLIFFGGLIIILDFTSAGMVPINSPKNPATVEKRPPLGKPINTPGIHRPERPSLGNNISSSAQQPLTFGILQQKPPSNYASSQSAVGNSQSHLIVTQNSAGPGAEPLVYIASTQNAINGTENNHIVPSVSATTEFAQNAINEAHSAIFSEVFPTVTDHTSMQHQPYGEQPATSTYQVQYEVVPESTVHISVSGASPVAQSASDVIIPNNSIHEDEEHFNLEAYLAQANLALEGVSSNTPYAEENQVFATVASDDVSGITVHNSDAVHSTEPLQVDAQLSSPIFNAAASSPSETADNQSETFAETVSNNVDHLTSGAPEISQEQILSNENSIEQSIVPVQAVDVVSQVEDMSAEEQMQVIQVAPSSALNDYVVTDQSEQIATHFSSASSSQTSVQENFSQFEPALDAFYASPSSSIPTVEVPTEEVVSPLVPEEINPNLFESTLSETNEVVQASPAPTENSMAEEHVTSVIVPQSIEIFNTPAGEEISNDDDEPTFDVDQYLAQAALLLGPSRHQSNKQKGYNSKLVNGLSFPNEVHTKPTLEDLSIFSNVNDESENKLIKDQEHDTILPHQSQTNFNIIPESEHALNDNSVQAHSKNSSEDASVTPHSVNEKQMLHKSSPSGSSSGNYLSHSPPSETILAAQQLLESIPLPFSPDSHELVFDEENSLFILANPASHADNKDKTFKENVNIVPVSKPALNDAPVGIYNENSEQILKGSNHATPESGYYVSHSAPSESVLAAQQLLESIPLPFSPDSHELDFDEEHSLFILANPTSLEDSENEKLEHDDQQLKDSEMKVFPNNAKVQDPVEFTNNVHKSSKSERSRPPRPTIGISRPSSLGIAPLYSYSGSKLNTPVEGEDIKLTHGSLSAANSNKQNGTLSTVNKLGEPPKHSIVSLLGGSAYNSYFNGTKLHNVSTPNAISPFGNNQNKLGRPEILSYPALQHAVLNNTNIVGLLNTPSNNPNNSDPAPSGPTQYQQYYNPEDSVKLEMDNKVNISVMPPNYAANNHVVKRDTISAPGKRLAKNVTDTEASEANIGNGQSAGSRSTNLKSSLEQKKPKSKSPKPQSHQGKDKTKVNNATNTGSSSKKGQQNGKPKAPKPQPNQEQENKAVTNVNIMQNKSTLEDVIKVAFTSPGLNAAQQEGESKAPQFIHEEKIMCSISNIKIPSQDTQEDITQVSPVSEPLVVPNHEASLEQPTDKLQESAQIQGSTPDSNAEKKGNGATTGETEKLENQEGQLSSLNKHKDDEKHVDLEELKPTSSSKQEEKAHDHQPIQSEKIMVGNKEQNKESLLQSKPSPPTETSSRSPAQKDAKPLAQKDAKPLAQKDTKPLAQKDAKPIAQKEAKPPPAKPSPPELPPIPIINIPPPPIPKVISAPSFEVLSMSESSLNSPTLPQDISELIGTVNIPFVPKFGENNKSGNNKGLKPKPSKKPSTAPNKGQHNSRPQVSQAPVVEPEPEKLNIPYEMTSSEESELASGYPPISLYNDNNDDVRGHGSMEPTNEKALPPKYSSGRPFSPVFSNPMIQAQAQTQNFPIQNIPVLAVSPSSSEAPEKECPCNSKNNNNTPSNPFSNNSGGKDKPISNNSNNSAGKDKPMSSNINNSGGKDKPNSSNNYNSGGKDKPIGSNSNNGGGKDKPISTNNNNNYGASKNNSTSKPNTVNTAPAPTSAPKPLPTPTYEEELEDIETSNVRPPRPTKPKRPVRPNGGSKKPKPKPSDKLKDVEVPDDDEIDPELLQQMSTNKTEINGQNTLSAKDPVVVAPAPIKRPELYTMMTIFGWEVPIINWSYFTEVFQSFFVEKFRTSAGEFTCDDSDNEATVLRSELDVDYLCEDEPDYSRRDIDAPLDSNICSMFCNMNGFSGGLCMPQKSCLCYMNEKKNFAIKLDRLQDYNNNNGTEKFPSETEECQNCRCLKSCQNNGKYVGYCSKSCHCGVPWYNENPNQQAPNPSI